MNSNDSFETVKTSTQNVCVCMFECMYGRLKVKKKKKCTQTSVPSTDEQNMLKKMMYELNCGKDIRIEMDPKKWSHKRRRYAGQHLACCFARLLGAMKMLPNFECI